MKKIVTNAARPIAVLISDIHFNLKNLPLASAALQQAYDYANDSDLPLIIAGDLHDTKANIRGECVNAINSILKPNMIEVYVLVGNHDKINEKGEEHSLNFLPICVKVIDEPSYSTRGIYFIPYKSDQQDFNRAIKQAPAGEIVVCHQGILGSNMGEYVQDKSAVDTKDLPANIRVISGHYHARQTIELPNGGQWDYIGSPYTMSFGEAADPEKGFQVLYEDGSLEFVPTNLRKHCIFEPTAKYMIDPNMNQYYMCEDEDIVWVKVKGTKEELSKINKNLIANKLQIRQPFKLDLIPDKVESKSTAKKSATQAEILDSVIQSSTGIEEATKQRLKELWKSYAN